MVQVQVRIKVDSDGVGQLEVDNFAREDATELERQMAIVVEMLIRNGFEEAAKIAGQEVTIEEIKAAPKED